MLKELFVAICDRAVRAASPVVVSTEDRITVDGAVALVSHQRQDRIDSLESFALAVKGFADVGEASIYVGRDAVVCVLDDSELRARFLRMPLVHTDIFASLAKLDGTARPAKDTIRLLSHTLGLGPDCPLVTKLRRIEWSVNAREANDKRGFGAEIDAKVAGLDDLPDEILFDVEVYRRLPGITSSIRLSVEVDAGAKTLAVQPYPDQLERAKDATLEGVVEWLNSHGLEHPVFLGVPGGETVRPEVSGR